MAVRGRHGHDLKLAHGLGLVPVASAQAIRAGVAAADDHHALAGGQNLAGTSSPATRLFCCGKNSIAKWMPLSSRPGTFRSRGFRAAGEQNRVEFLAQILHRHVPPTCAFVWN
jgi:hypothetical protein